MRRSASFRDLQPAVALSQAKHRTNVIETAPALEGRGRFNIDLGYLDPHKVVRASYKGRGSKAYLHEEVWAEITLLYSAGRWETLKWTFPDFRDGRYDTDFLRLRDPLKARLRQVHMPHTD